MKEYLVFDWGGTYLKYALMQEDTAILEQGKVPSPGKEDTLEIFLSTIDAIIEKYRARIAGIAVSAPGIIDSSAGILKVVGAFPYLCGYALKEETEKRWGVPVSVENDAKCAALAEYWKGNLAGCTNGAVMILGTSVGGGIILDGKLRRGPHGSAGEFSGMCTNLNDPGNDASYWGALGTRGLLKMYADKTEKDPAELTGEAFFERVNIGEATALDVLYEYTGKLAMQIFGLNLLLDLNKVCVGGGISRQPMLLKSLQRSIEHIKKIHPDLVQGTELPLPVTDVCKFYNEANLIGALYHLLYEK
ncbi:MAG: ROK family protein [Solobacterium sp.]|nr:ROK family protein [Solobacterium sp.]